MLARDVPGVTIPSLLRLAGSYLVVVTVGLWTRFLIDEMRQATELSRAVVSASSAVFGGGLVPVAVVATLLLPGMVLSVELGSRAGAASAVRRAVTGMAAWAAWGLALAFIASALSPVVLLPDLVASHLALIAGGGGAFALLAFDGRPVAGRRGLVVVGVLAAVLVVLGALLMAGRWGSAA